MSPVKQGTLQGGKPIMEWEIEKVYDFGPRTLTAKGTARKIKDLHFFVKWRGIREGIDAKKPYRDLKGTAEDALKDLVSALETARDAVPPP